jgi:hypothetical protein
VDVLAEAGRCATEGRCVVLGIGDFERASDGREEDNI